MSPHISIKGEVVFELLGFPITNSLLTTLLVVAVFFFIARYYFNQLKMTDRSLLFYALHGLFKGIYGMLQSVLHKKTKIFYPLLGSFFFFILLANWSGLVPGVGSILIEPPAHAVETEQQLDVPADEAITIEEDLEALDVGDHDEEVLDYEAYDEHDIAIENGETETNGDAHAEEEAHAVHKVPLFRGGTADLNTTLALALVSVFMTQLYGFKFLGPVAHLKKYFDFRDPVMIMLGPLEIIQEFARIISFAFRLYGNIFAGEVLLTIVPFLLPVFLSFFVTPMFLMEIFVGFVQALVFVMLSAVFINMAVAEHH